jgi:hypothetical protein
MYTVKKSWSHFSKKNSSSAKSTAHTATATKKALANAALFLSTLRKITGKKCLQLKQQGRS